MRTNHSWREARISDRGKAYAKMDVGSHQPVLGAGPLLSTIYWRRRYEHCSRFQRVVGFLERKLLQNLLDPVVMYIIMR